MSQNIYILFEDKQQFFGFSIANNRILNKMFESSNELLTLSAPIPDEEKKK